MVVTPQRKSRLFETLSEMGLLYTPQAAIENIREQYRLYSKVYLSNDDIQRVSYLGPHFITTEAQIPYMEMWINDEYVNPNDIKWITINKNRVYGILPKAYKPEETNCRVYYNQNIIHRYTATPRDGIDKTYHFEIDIEDIHFSKIENPEMSCFYITNNEVRIPEYEWVSSAKLRVRAPYVNDIDFFMCSNLVSVTKASANVGVYVDYPSSKQCYYSFVIDSDDLYPINTAFYPCVMVDKDCIVRLYSDKRSDVAYPYTCRLTLYPEFMSIDDPYNTDNEYLSNYIPSMERISGIDSEDDIYRKFSTIVAGSYRMWEKIPVSSLEESDFIICDNNDGLRPTFEKFEYHDPNGIYTGIRSNVPFEESRDILFYEGMMCTDYQVLNIYHMTDGSYEINDSLGTLVYVLSDKYDVDKLTLIKFNVAEDTHLINSNEYFNKENFLQLHYKLNRFYRNMMTLKREILDISDDDQVRVSTKQPTIIDEHLWFELLVNVQPEMFQSSIIDKIDVTRDEIPDPIRNGAYRIDTDTLDGNKSYYNALLTYLELGKRQKDYLALQYGDGIPDPTVRVFHDIRLGDSSQAEDRIDGLFIEDPSIDSVVTKEVAEYGPPEDPGPLNHAIGDLYAQSGEYIIPDTDNIDITSIEYGDNEAKRDTGTLWIDPEDTHSDEPSDLPVKDSLDSIINGIKSTNDSNNLTASIGDMVYDAIDDDYSGPLFTDSAIEMHEPLDKVDLMFEDTGTFIEDDLQFATEGNDINSSEPNIKLDDPDLGLDLDDLMSGIDTTPPTEPEIGDTDGIFEGLNKALMDGITVDSVENPTTGMFAFDDITFTDSSGTVEVDMVELEKLSIGEKLDIVKSIIMDDDEPQSIEKGTLWLEYLSRVNATTLNTIVAKVILMKNLYDRFAKLGDLGIEGDTMPDLELRRLVYGDDEFAAQPDQIMISHINGTEYTKIRKAALKYIMSRYEPEDVAIGDLWLDMPAIPLIDFIEDIIANIMLECGVEPPTGFYDGTHTTIAFDYGAHGTDIETELFQEVDDESLHPIYYDKQPNIRDLEQNDIWIEFLDNIQESICYSDESTMVLRVDNHLYGVQFDTDNVTTFLFDDIVLNFKHSLGVKYLSILADLINSNVIQQDEINIFYKRLMTDRDTFDPMLRRLYTGTSHVVSMAKIDEPEYMLTYSSNIGRLRIDYRYVNDDTKEAAYRMIIDYSEYKDFAFLNKRMLLFVNGKYIPTNMYHEHYANKIQLLNFDEIIATVDILYSKKDEHLMKLKRLANVYWNSPDTSQYITNIDSYNVMNPITLSDHTYQGFYDVLIHEYIENNRLVNMLKYLEKHPDEYDDFKKDLISKFYDITDVGLCDEGNINDTHIVLPLINNGDAKYYINE